jgi:hypothetical protein
MVSHGPPSLSCHDFALHPPVAFAKYRLPTFFIVLLRFPQDRITSSLQGGEECRHDGQEPALNAPPHVSSRSPGRPDRESTKLTRGLQNLGFAVYYPMILLSKAGT